MLTIAWFSGLLERAAQMLRVVVVQLESGGLVALSPREKLMLRRLAQGKTDHQIAVEIGGRQDQVRLQRERLLRRLQIKSERQLAAVALRLAPWPVRSTRNIKQSPPPLLR
ncbi:LuxR C-terminal-related transcriptional regulator [Bradyrhizobium sp. CB3481]|uniref:LuxR C-terminal-related transcriptional regulator n=1 Tax=Bradyrhizobium sp. CB3481 TaxID=3039158 RepID=UPI0024B0911C|nr:LuxR C-terminal-related transcriptional regulator [Bradyrhizobium sp. CB3481]WFU18495.1 LuxR C-terminal-related transcriptional regulator [Bradyrhizobium sp. CB3481]